MCSVHMLRNWCKHWKRIGAKIWKTPEFHNVWQILRGSPYIPKIANPPQTITKLFMGIKAFQLHMMNERKVWGKTKSKGKRKKHLIEKHNIMRYGNFIWWE